MRTVTLGAALFLTTLALSACSSTHERRRGEPCALTSECEVTLVCSLGACRTECRESRDCPLGALCVLDDTGGGACQLPEESSCALSSECPSGLVCAASTCTNECFADRDCLVGAVCDIDLGGCIARADPSCIYTSDCPEPLICTSDGMCRPECIADRDCPAGETCVDGSCE